MTKKKLIIVKNGKPVTPEATQPEPPSLEQHERRLKELETKLDQMVARLQAAGKQIEGLNELKDDFKDLSKRLRKQASVRDSERQLLYGDGFRAGIRRIVDVAEGFIIEHYGAKNRQELFDKALMPTFWIATLIQCLHEATPEGVPPTTQERLGEEEEVPEVKPSEYVAEVCREAEIVHKELLAKIERQQ